MASGYIQSELIRAKKVAIVVDEKSLAEVSKRYGVPEATLKQLNPHATLTAGELLWLVAPVNKLVSSGPYTTLGDICEKQLGNKLIWPAVWSLNPAIRDPNKVQPNNMIRVPERSPALSELLANMRSGKAEAVVRKDLNKPMVYLDDAKAAQALGQWLAQQKWDPQGRTAAALAKLYTTNFKQAADNTYIEFLSRGFPNIEDPIFPDDPRYTSHIIRRP